MSVLTDTRRGYQRLTTQAFIDEDPTSIVIMRRTRVAKPGGGHDFVPSPLPAQNFRYINQDTSGGLGRGLDGGEVRSAGYVVIGRYDADVSVGDTWTDNGIKYEVDSFIPNNGYETRFHATGFASEPEHG